MGWTLELRDHEEGYPLVVLPDGQRISTGDGSAGVGWMAACSCGWRSSSMVPRKDYPSLDGWPDMPDEDDPVYEAWETHAKSVDSIEALQVAAANARSSADALDRAVADARAAGRSWEQIGRAVGITRQSAHERWSRSRGV